MVNLMIIVLKFQTYKTTFSALSTKFNFLIAD